MNEEEQKKRFEILDNNLKMLNFKIDCYKTHYDCVLTRTEILKLKEKCQLKLKKLREKDDFEKLNEEKNEEYFEGFIDALDKITSKEKPPREMDLRKY